MYKSIMALFLPFMLLVSCNQEANELVTIDRKVITPTSITDFFSNSFKDQASINNPYKLSPEQQIEIHPIFFKYKNQLVKHQVENWQKLASDIKTDFDEIASSTEPLLYNNAFQTVAIAMLRYQILPDGEGLKRRDRQWLHYFTDLLFEHQGVDLDVMVDALVVSRVDLSDADYLARENYLMEKVTASEVYVRDHFDEFNEIYKNATDRATKEKYKMELFLFKIRMDEARYVRDILDKPGLYTYGLE